MKISQADFLNVFTNDCKEYSGKSDGSNLKETFQKVNEYSFKITNKKRGLFFEANKQQI